MTETAAAPSFSSVNHETLAAPSFSSVIETLAAPGSQHRARSTELAAPSFSSVNQKPRARSTGL
jgi:hypothetical protein